jgi:DNA-binding TFAR19-related protein (PDSD5 family)
MVENIPQVNYMDTSQWPKDMHLGYAKNVVRRIDEEWTEVYPAPAKLLDEITPLKTAVTKEDTDYEQSRKADQTEAIRQADEERDALLNQALTVIDAMAKVSAIPASQTAALQLKGQVDIYKPSAKLALRDESTQVEQWLQAISQSAVLEAAVATLGLTQILADLKTKNDQVIELMDARAADRAQRALIQLSEDRKETDRCMRNFFRMLDAAACMDADETRYLNVLGKLQQDQTEWRQRYDDYRRTAKRVSVKSTIVGNHLYSASRGWTWAQLIDDGKALIDIDPDDDTRIVSTDKKAEKAGGLYLALAGTLVKPTDDIDTDKEYQLIALPE